MSTAFDVKKIKALVFDVFGTVVDWRSSILHEGAVLSAQKGLQVDWPGLVDAWRAGYPVAMQRARSGEIAWANVDTLHRGILDELIPRFGLQSLTEPERVELNRAWHRLDPWPDAVAGLHRLKKRFVISTLSNGNIALLVDMAKHAGLPWDCVLSAELMQHYKPDREVYQGAARLLDLKFDELLMVAAHPNDLRGAAQAGLRTALVNRPTEYGPNPTGQPAPSALPDDRFDLVTSDFHDLADRLGC